MNEYEMTRGYRELLDDVVKPVLSGENEVVILKDGKPVAVIISYEEYKALNKLTEAFGE